MGPGPGTLDGTASSDGATMGGTADTGPSFDPICGDGIVEEPEECDLGELNDTGMYCTGECTSNVCGDGYVGPGEACDDGNLDNGDLCTSECGPASCGDGKLQGGEQCDAGKDNSETGACLPSCQLATCGDLFIQAGVETCDGSNIGGQSCETQGFDGGVLVCGRDCTSFDTSSCYACGNGEIEPGEDCDGADLGGNTCATFAPAGTNVSGGALWCSASCTINSNACTYCGDAMLEGTEDCEAGMLGGETCASVGFDGGMLACTNCSFNTAGCTECGDGVAEGTEQCDGVDLDGATCSTLLGAGYRGPLSCNMSCQYSTIDCCTSNGAPCMLDAECCSGNCLGMTDVCG
jgi:cysteine-rich repeat protein